EQEPSEPPRRERPRAIPTRGPELLAEPLEVAARTVGHRRIESRRTGGGRRHPVRRAILLILVVLLVPVGRSYGCALHAPGSAPRVGGTPKGGIPGAAAQPDTPKSGAHSTVSHLAAPPAIPPLAKHPLPREGTWQPVGQQVGGAPTMYEAFLRPDQVHTSLLAG